MYVDRCVYSQPGEHFCAYPVEQTLHGTTEGRSSVNGTKLHSWIDRNSGAWMCNASLVLVWEFLVTRQGFGNSVLCEHGWIELAK